MKRSVWIALAVGTAAQLAMVLAGHRVAVIRERGFALGGMLLSLGAGLLAARLLRREGALSKGSAALAGAIVGGGCALLGIAVSLALGDVPAFVLAVGTISSTLTGSLGALLGRLGARPEAAPTTR